MLHPLRRLSRQSTGQGCGTGEILLLSEMGGVRKVGTDGMGEGAGRAGGMEEETGPPLCDIHTSVHHPHLDDKMWGFLAILTPIPQYIQELVETSFGRCGDQAPMTICVTGPSLCSSASVTAASPWNP